MHPVENRIIEEKKVRRSRERERVIERRSKEIMLKIESEKELKIVCERKTEHNRKPEKEWARE